MKDLSELVCKICDAQLQSVVGFRSHMLRHTTTAKFQCDQCEKFFYKEKDVQHHRKNHFTPKPAPKIYQCQVCHEGKQQFRYPKHYEKHMEEVHPDVAAPLSCETCGRNFFLKISLVHHRNQGHNFIKPYKCNQCPKKFRHEHLLRHHVQTAHEGLRFHCPMCSTTFTFKDRMKRHYRRAHKEHVKELDALFSSIELS